MKCFALVCSRPEYGSAILRISIRSNCFSVPILAYLLVLIPFSSTKGATAGLWQKSSPLFKEEWDLSDAALSTDFDSPFFSHRSCLGAAFATHDCPVDPL